jgi:hypothetical protein
VFPKATDTFRTYLCAAGHVLICRYFSFLQRWFAASLSWHQRSSSITMGILWSIVILCAIFTELVLSSPLRESGILLKSRDDSRPIVDLGYATYQGSTDISTNISTFLSIRYAAPPTGESMPITTKFVK